MFRFLLLGAMSLSNLLSCSQEQRISLRGQGITESGTAGQKPPEELSSTTDHLADFPEGMSPGASPFQERKVWFGPHEMQLAEAANKLPALIIYKKSDPQCEHEIPKTPGIDMRTRHEFFGTEYVVSAELAVDYAERFLATLDCVIGVVLNPESSTDLPIDTNPMLKGLGLTSNSIDEYLEWDRSVEEFFASRLAKVKLAIVDTGLDLKNKAFTRALTPDLRVTSLSRDANFSQLILASNPQDQHGHGTRIASIAAHESLGLAPNHIELIPIKISSNGGARLSDLVVGISMAVNKGADVISVSMGNNANGCNPAIGYALYRARERGAFVTLSAGNGMANPSGKVVGFPLVAARDDGPANYEWTQTPACWGRYFLGSVAVAAADQDTGRIAHFSNYGDDIEIAAPGVAIPTIELDGKEVLVSGSSYAVGYVATAAVFAISHHRSLGFKFSPWYIENLLIESATKNANALDIERRVRFDARLSFKNLAVLLKKTETMTERERRTSIRTINPRDGDGWKPGEDQANLRLVKLSLNSADVFPGETIQYKAHAFYRHGPEIEITSSKHSFASLSRDDLATVSTAGVIKISDASAFDFRVTPYVDISFTINYDEAQAQTFASKILRVHKPVPAAESDQQGTPASDGTSESNSGQPPPELRSLEIRAPQTPVRVFQTFNAFEAIGIYSDGSNRNLTGSVQWSSSVPMELRITEAAGVMDAMAAVAGRKYVMHASLGSIRGELEILVEPEVASSFFIHSFLGQDVEVEVGQKLVLEPRFILSDKREASSVALWTMNGEVVQDGRKTSRFELDTTDMKPDRYVIGAVSSFKSSGEEREFVAEFVLNLGTSIERVEIHLKTPIVQVGQEFQVDLRAYRKNNSYTVVTNAAKWSVDQPDLVTIGQGGIGVVDPYSPPGRVTISAEYSSLRHSLSFNTVLGSVSTGSNSAIEFLVLKIDPRGYCKAPMVSVDAHYKDASVRSVAVQSVAFEQLTESGNYQAVSFPLYGGRKYRVSATYNDGNANVGGGGHSVMSTEFVMPKSQITELKLSYMGGKDIPTPLTIKRKNGLAMAKIQAADVCAVRRATVRPENELSATIIGTDVYVKSTSLNSGPYRLEVEALFTGQGRDEVFRRELEISIADARPVQLKLRPQSGIVGHSEFLPFGSQYFAVELFDEDGERFPATHDEFVRSLYRDEVAIQLADSCSCKRHYLFFLSSIG